MGRSYNIPGGGVEIQISLPRKKTITYKTNIPVDGFNNPSIWCRSLTKIYPCTIAHEKTNPCSMVILEKYPGSETKAYPHRYQMVAP